MPLCEFPLCKRFARSGHFCVNHSIFEGVKVERAPVKKIAPKSKVNTINHREYKKMVIEYALISNKCEIHSPVCSKKMQGFHHMKKRGQFLMDKRFLKRACNNCNSYLENNTDWGIEHGFILSKFNESETV